MILQLIHSLERKILLLNSERATDNLRPLGRVELKVLGQFGLMLHPEASQKLHLIKTRDFDALITADWSIRAYLREELARLALDLDELSSEIWMPPETKCWVLHESELIRCEVAEPIFILASKAIKAPEKNRQLIEDAIGLLGEPLIKLIKKHGGEINF